MCKYRLKTRRIFAGLLAASFILSCACSKKDTSSEETEKSRSLSSVTSETTPAESETTKVTEPTETPASTETQVSEVTPTPTPTSTPTPVPTTFNATKADAYLDSVYFDGVVLVSENDQIIYTRASGLADRDNNVPNTMDTVFELGSITKQFTAVAIMQLVEQGKLSTDETLDKYIPEYAYAKDITIHQLLNMTSGVPDYLYCGVLGFTWDDLENLSLATIFSFEAMMREIVTTPLDHDDLVKRISEYPLDFTPGTEFAYSNTNYYFLGIIIEQLSGMPYDEYVRKNILEPLGLNELFPDTQHLTSNGRTDLALIHLDFPHQDDSISYSVGVMTGTAEGLLEWEKHVMDGALLTKESWDKIFDGGAFGYGYGWYIDNGFIEHSGMTLGYNANVRVDKENRRVVIVLCNIQLLNSTPFTPMASDVGEEMWKYFG